MSHSLLHRVLIRTRQFGLTWYVRSIEYIVAALQFCHTIRSRCPFRLCHRRFAGGLLRCQKQRGLVCVYFVWHLSYACDSMQRQLEEVDVERSRQRAELGVKALVAWRHADCEAERG
jgi:hypothetical protein